MAKQKQNVSKLIRDYLEEHPDAKPAEIRNHLATDHRVDAQPQYISTIKSNTKRRSLTTSDDPGVARLLLAKRFVAELGGVSEAASAIRDFAALCGELPS